MGSIRPFAGSRLVVAVLSAAGDVEVLDRSGPLLGALEGRFGAADYARLGMPFAWTTYYAGELGASIARSFFSFPRLVDPASLASVKSWTNELEERFAGPGVQDGQGNGEPRVGGSVQARRERGRRFNLDPGLLSLGGFVLATTKNRPHRIALSDGIYAELTLIFEGGRFRPLPWTYPDWASPEYAAVLLELRSRLKLALRGQNPARG